jgi:hypothetical protein
MRAVAHGWKPTEIKAPPVKVAKEFSDADMERESLLKPKIGRPKFGKLKAFLK